MFAIIITQLRRYIITQIELSGLIWLIWLTIKPRERAMDRSWPHETSERVIRNLASNPIQLELIERSIRWSTCPLNKLQLMPLYPADTRPTSRAFRLLIFQLIPCVDFSSKLSVFSLRRLLLECPDT
jgi:hypothetical protein